MSKPFASPKGLLCISAQYLVIPYLYAVVCLFSVLWSPHSKACSPLAILDECLGDNRNFSLGAAESLVTITVVGAKLCLAQCVLSNSSSKRLLVRIKNRALSWPVTIFSSGDFLKKGGLPGNPQWTFLPGTYPVSSSIHTA